MQQLLTMPMLNGDATTQLSQMRSYLIQLREQLEFALNNISVNDMEANTKMQLESLIEKTKETENEIYMQEQKIESVKRQIISVSDVVSSETFIKAMEKTADSIKSEVGEKYIAQTDRYPSADKLVEASVEEIRSTTMEQTKTGVDVTCSHEVVTEVDGNTNTHYVKPYLRLGLIGTDENGVEYYGLKIGQLEGVIKVADGQYVVDDEGNYVYDLTENPYTTETTKEGYKVLENGIPIQWVYKNTSYAKKQVVEESQKIGNSANGFMNFISTSGGLALKWSDA